MSNTTLHDLLNERLVFEKVIIEGKKEGKQLYEPGFSVYSIIKNAVDNEALYNKWALATGNALFFLFEETADNVPDTKILLERVMQHKPPTRFDNQLIFPAILVKDFDDAIRKKDEIKELFRGDSFVANKCNLIFRCDYPIGGESSFLARLYEVGGEMKPQIESLVKNTEKFNDITKLKVQEAEPLSYHTAFYSKRDELNSRVLFYVSARLCQYHLEKQNEDSALEIISLTLERMKTINHQQYFYDMLEANPDIKDGIEKIVTKVQA